MLGPRAVLRNARYALPRQIERLGLGPGPKQAAGLCRRLDRRGLATTLGYFQSGDARPEEIVAASIAAAGLLAGGGDSCLSVKAPPLAFDRGHLRAVADAAAAAGLALTFDAHAAKDADRTLEAVRGFLSEFPRTGFALPARWRRSLADADEFRDGPARIRVVKGEWADPGWMQPDVESSYIALVARLAGRAAPVAVATHDPRLAERALSLLLDSGTPCELEQLRGLPARRTMAIARRLGVPVRIYVPFGPGWWPYALDKALARPYLPLWTIRDRLGLRDPPPPECGAGDPSPPAAGGARRPA